MAALLSATRPLPPPQRRRPPSGPSPTSMFLILQCTVGPSIPDLFALCACASHLLDGMPGPANILPMQPFAVPELLRPKHTEFGRSWRHRREAEGSRSSNFTGGRQVGAPDWRSKSPSSKYPRLLHLAQIKGKKYNITRLAVGDA